ncbi:hypothetical protein FKM82_025028 [Ascaphus truei]
MSPNCVPLLLGDKSLPLFLWLLEDFQREFLLAAGRVRLLPGGSAVFLTRGLLAGQLWDACDLGVVVLGLCAWGRGVGFSGAWAVRSGRVGLGLYRPCQADFSQAGRLL